MITLESRSLVYVKRVFLIIAVIFVARLAFLQIFVHEEYSADAETIRTISYETAPHRGTIYDRNGVVLAVSVNATTIYANPCEVTDAKYEARQISKILKGNANEYEKLLRTPDTSFVYIKRQIDESLADKVKDLELDGIYFLEESRREYPNGSIGGNIIGAVDTDGNGICGLEYQYNDILMGTPGVYSAERGLIGTPIPGGVHEDVRAVDGTDIMISIDITLQDEVEKALEKGLKKNDAKNGSAIVMDPETGDIYAMSSYPYLDPGDLKNSLVGSDNLTCVTQAFEPGSVFKSFASLAILEEKALSPNSTIYVPAKLKANEYTITDAHKHPAQTMTFSRILEVSSNIGISRAVELVGFEKLYEILTSLKFGTPTGIDYPGEDSGKLSNVDDWAKIDGYSISFGQGMTATPLQVAYAYGAIANNGSVAQPHFLIALPQTGEWKKYKKEQLLTDKKAIRTLKKMLRGVVTKGTGKDASISGYDVVGKTSTAEIAENGSYAKSRYNLCFAGFVANSSSNLVCNVVANNVRYDGNVASVFHDIMVEAIDLYKIVPE